MSAPQASILVLDKPVMIEILTFLPIKEYKTFMLLNKFFLDCCKSDYLWKPVCTYLFPTVSQNFYSEFLSKIFEFTRISNAFYKILKVFENNGASQLLQSLKISSNPKLANVLSHYLYEDKLENLSEISSFFTGFKFVGNEQISWAHLLYNGQGVLEPGFFGCYEFYDVDVSLKYLQYEQMQNPSVFAVSGIGNERIILFVDYENKLKNGAGSVYCTTGLPNTALWLAGSFTEYLEAYASKLLTRSLRVTDSKVLLYEYNEYSSTNSEYGIKITATALFIPHLSQHRRLLWSYLVTIEEDNPDKKWQLTTRTWKIQDSNGDLQTVDRQPGVIGLYPKVYKGSQPTQYTSCCYLKTAFGSMSGFFTFKDLQTLQTVDVQIPPFFLEVPKGSKLVKTN